jgi:hypothetical protein
MTTRPLVDRRISRAGRREFLFLGVMSCIASSCTPPKIKDRRKLFQLGERVEVGGLVFNILESKWLVQLGEVPDFRTPKHKFLTVRLSITNQGGGAAGCPFLSILNSKDEKFTELDDAKLLDGWLGLLRILKPGESEIGWIVFDAPPSSYILQLSDGKIEEEKIAYVELPLRLD